MLEDLRERWVSNRKIRRLFFIDPHMEGSEIMAKKQSADIKELKKVFEETNDNRSKLALSLLDKAEFMEDTLKKLQQKVKDDGVVTSMCQGKYDIDRENPALKSYNTTIKNYTSVIKQLNDMLPTEEKPKDDGFEKFGDD